MARQSDPRTTRLGEKLLEFISEMDRFDNAETVLDSLHRITSQECQMNVLGALQFPLRSGDWDNFVKNQTVFIHSCVPKTWWDEYSELSRQHTGIAYMFAQLSLAPFTNSDLLRMVQPLAIDHWAIDLSHKYGMRDGLTCPVGGRWVFAYWSPKVLPNQFCPELRAMLFMGAIFATIRLQEIISEQSKRNFQSASLTARELAVLRLLSMGNQTSQIAEALQLGEETVRSHIKKAQVKLGVRNRLHAVAQAIRLKLIP